MELIKELIKICPAIRNEKKTATERKMLEKRFLRNKWLINMFVFYFR